MSWLGWSMIFASGHRSVVDATTLVAGDLLDKIYFAGYTVFTLGNGDLVPVSGWRIVTVIASGTGLMVVTLSITYLVPLLSAVVEKRTLAARLHVVGGDIDRLVRNLTGPGGDEVLSEMRTVPPEVLLLKERHLAYPVLHYFQTKEKETAISLNLAIASEALTAIVDGAEDAPPELVVVADKMRISTWRLVEALEPWFVTREPETPPLPALEVLAGTGLNARPAAEFENRAAASAKLRRYLRWMLQDTGWSWDADVIRGAPKDTH